MMLDFIKKEYSILIVGRDTVLNSYLVKELRPMYTVFLEENSELAMRNTQINEPNLILIDFDLPEQEGVELCNYFTSNEITEHLPLFAMTNNLNVKDELAVINRGVEAYFEKPFSIKILKATIKQTLAKRKILLKKYSLGLSNISINDVDNISETDRNFMQSVLAFVQDKLKAQDLNVEIMASHFLLSRSQFYRKIKSQTGLSPNEFIRKIRLEKAKKLLATNDLNVNEVIYEVGFSSSSYFAKCFRKEFGYLPMQVKKK